METIVNTLKKKIPKLLLLAKQTADCFEPYRKNDSYVTAYRGLNKDVAMKWFNCLRKSAKGQINMKMNLKPALMQNLNSLVLKNAEKYYEAMAQFDNSSWNVRDSHMVETLNTLMNYHGEDAKVIVWEHNTHIGDARATNMASSGLHNVGQLVRQQHKKEGVVLVGFGSYEGSVVAGEFWGAPMENMELPKAIDGSIEKHVAQHGCRE